MCRYLFLLLFFVSFSLAEVVVDDGEWKIVRPAKLPVRDDLKDKVEDEKMLVLPQNRKLQQQIVSDSSESSSSEEDDQDERKDALSALVMKKMMDELIQSFSDYQDYSDVDRDFPRNKPIGKQEPSVDIDSDRPVPRLSIDPPRKPFPGVTKEEKEETNEIQTIPIIFVDGTQQTEPVILPWQIFVSLDVSHILLIGLAGLLIFWVLNKAFSYYYRSRPTIISPITIEENKAQDIKIPLP